jgi:hypothetical protein
MFEFLLQRDRQEIGSPAELAGKSFLQAGRVHAALSSTIKQGADHTHLHRVSYAYEQKMG